MSLDGLPMVVAYQNRFEEELLALCFDVNVQEHLAFVANVVVRLNTYLIKSNVLNHELEVLFQC